MEWKNICGDKRWTTLDFIKYNQAIFIHYNKYLFHIFQGYNLKL